MIEVWESTSARWAKPRVIAHARRSLCASGRALLNLLTALRASGGKSGTGAAQNEQHRDKNFIFCHFFYDFVVSRQG